MLNLPLYRIERRIFQFSQHIGERLCGDTADDCPRPDHTVDFELIAGRGFDRMLCPVHTSFDSFGITARNSGNGRQGRRSDRLSHPYITVLERYLLFKLQDRHLITLLA